MYEYSYQLCDGNVMVSIRIYLIVVQCVFVTLKVWELVVDGFYWIIVKDDENSKKSLIFIESIDLHIDETIFLWYLQYLVYILFEIEMYEPNENVYKLFLDLSSPHYG